MSIGFAVFAASIALMTVATPEVAGGADAGTPIGSGIVIMGATVTSPSRPVRELNSDQAAAFMQTWLPTSIFGHVGNETPPKSLPVSSLSVRYSFTGLQQHPMVVYYASNGTNAWVGMPQQNLWPGAYVTSERWIRAPDAARTIAAFAGAVKPIPVVQPVTPTTSPRVASKPSAGGSSPWTIPLITAGGALLVVVAAVAALKVRRGRGALVKS